MIQTPQTFNSPDSTKHSGRHHVTVSMVWLWDAYLHLSVQRCLVLVTIGIVLDYMKSLPQICIELEGCASQTPREAHSFE